MPTGSPGMSECTTSCLVVLRGLFIHITFERKVWGNMQTIQRRLFSTFVGGILAWMLIQLVNLGGGLQAQAASHDPANSGQQMQSGSPNCPPCYYFFVSNHSGIYTATYH